ncbi:MAG: glycosyltransferase [Bacteroidota bacterium]|nr:glycosyltransferase [Bacteroidota bacterium]MDP4251707.1 glycosyltransferase [Bacteroidota bacterium]
MFRSLAFVKYLTRYGINPVVITLDPSSFADMYDGFVTDETLGRELMEKTSIVPVPSEKSRRRTRVGEFVSIYFSILGNEVNNWKGNYFRALPDLIDKYRPEAIFATVPPFSILPLVLETANRYKLPLILDFRDAWSQWRVLPYGTRIHYWLTLGLERKYLSKADAVVATSQQTIEDFKQLHPGIPKSRFHYIPNGYDGALEKWEPVNADKQQITIGYVGSFYFSPAAREQMLKPWWKKRGHRMLQYIPRQQDWLYRSPYFFFKALQWLKKLDPVTAARVQVKFVGKSSQWLEEMISESGLQDQVHLCGVKPHDEALAFEKECDILLITSAKRIGGNDYSIAGKTFEYIQAQKPVLAFVSAGAQKELLEKTGIALICDPDQGEDSAKKMIRLLNAEMKLEPDTGFIKSLSRELLTGSLSDIIKHQILQKR